MGISIQTPRVTSNRLVGLEVACPPRRPKAGGSIPAGVDRFSECEGRRHACHMKIWHVKDPYSPCLALIILAKLNHINISFNEKFRFQNLVSAAARRWSHQ
ncbi:hypothetical protein TNCV_2072961 [Trichonephila clavipes]|nr:hypothetical protein TNCV_2072961 [Trichonephila clavipes]